MPKTAIESKAVKVKEYKMEKEPYYMPHSNEVEIFTAAYKNRLPVMLKGPTGCGKTRFLEYMAYKLKRPLITVSCHDDLTSSDLVGRYLIKGGETAWSDGPLTEAVRIGAICYLDEIVEARKDTTVVIHPLTDDRRILPIEKKGEVLKAAEGFMLVVSFNPGYQNILKNLKQSTRQRFISLTFDYPPKELEMEIVRHESAVDAETAKSLVTLGEKIRNLKNKGLEEGASTRLLIYAGQLIASGVSPKEACEASLAEPLTDEPDIKKVIIELVDTVMGGAV